MANLRLLYFGTNSRLSTRPLAALLAAPSLCTVVAVVLPRARGLPTAPPVRVVPVPAPGGGVRSLPVRGSGETLATLAAAHGLPLLESARLGHPHTLKALASFAPDLIVVSCFPRRLPAALLALPSLGALNLHPSLLPSYRGPEPLFWIFRDGLERAGVSLHLMTETFDSGPIVAQRAVALPDGSSYAAAEDQCAQVGAALLLETVERATADSRPIEGRAQDEALASGAPLPTDGDFVVSSRWSARRAYTFICGLASWGRAITLEVAGRLVTVRAALAYSPDERLSAPYHQSGDRLTVQCTPGTVTVTIEG